MECSPQRVQEGQGVSSLGLALERSVCCMEKGPGWGLLRARVVVMRGALTVSLAIVRSSAGGGGRSEEFLSEQQVSWATLAHERLRKGWPEAPLMRTVGSSGHSAFLGTRCVPASGVTGERGKGRPCVCHVGRKMREQVLHLLGQGREPEGSVGPEL